MKDWLDDRHEFPDWESLEQALEQANEEEDFIKPPPAFNGYLNELCARAWEIANANGFHDCPHNVPHHLALIHSEVSEALEADRRGEDLLHVTDEGKPEGLAAELADVVIRVAHLCALMGIDLHAAVEMKMGFNKTRPRKHGKRY